METAHGVFRHQNDRRHPATHQRPHAHTELPDRGQPQRGVLRLQHRDIQHSITDVQRHDIPHLHGGSTLYVAYVHIFMKKRAELDHKRFAQQSANQSSVVQLVNGMQEIKLSACERQKRWEWERIQAQLFRVNIKPCIEAVSGFAGARADKPDERTS